MKPSVLVRVVAGFVVVWTVACALVPVWVGNEIGMRRTSCGNVLSSLAGHGLQEYDSPALTSTCQDHAQDRLVLYVAVLVPFLVGALLVAVHRRLAGAREAPLLPAGPRWRDAAIYASCWFFSVLVPIGVLVASRDQQLRRTAARALEVHVVLLAVAFWFIGADRATSEGGSTMFLAIAVLVSFAAVGLAPMICAILAVTDPGSLERWEPLRLRRSARTVPVPA